MIYFVILMNFTMHKEQILPTHLLTNLVGSPGGKGGGVLKYIRDGDVQISPNFLPPKKDP